VAQLQHALGCAASLPQASVNAAHVGIAGEALARGGAGRLSPPAASERPRTAVRSTVCLMNAMPERVPASATVHANYDHGYPLAPHVLDFQSRPTPPTPMLGVQRSLACHACCGARPRLRFDTVLALWRVVRSWGGRPARIYALLPSFPLPTTTSGAAAFRRHPGRALNDGRAGGLLPWDSLQRWRDDRPPLTGTSTCTRRPHACPQHESMLALLPGTPGHIRHLGKVSRPFRAASKLSPRWLRCLTPRCWNHAVGALIKLAHGPVRWETYPDGVAPLGGHAVHPLSTNAGLCSNNWDWPLPRGCRRRRGDPVCLFLIGRRTMRQAKRHAGRQPGLALYGFRNQSAGSAMNARRPTTLARSPHRPRRPQRGSGLRTAPDEESGESDRTRIAAVSPARGRQEYPPCAPALPRSAPRRRGARSAAHGLPPLFAPENSCTMVAAPSLSSDARPADAFPLMK